MEGVDFNVGSGSTALKELYIYNNQFGNDTDNEIGKVLYCHPASTNEDKQLKQVGLCEAIIQFSLNFSDTSPCESLHTQKARYIFYQPEPGYWFVLVLTVPSVIKSSQEGIQVTDYHNDEVQDNVFHAYLDRLYQRFVLRNGKLETIVVKHQENGLVRVKELLHKFMDRSLKKWEPNRAGITDIFFGLKFLPLNKQMFLRVQCFVNHLLMTWNRIRHVLVLQGTQLVWSGVGQRDIQVLYDFLLRDAISTHFRDGGEHENRNGMILTCFSSLTLFDSLTTNGDSRAKGGSADNSGKLCHMCIYKSKQTYVVMIMHDDETNFLRELCNKIEGYMQQHLVGLARDLSDEAGGKNSTSTPTHRASSTGPFGLGSGIPSLPSTHLESSSNPNVKYVYFNYLNLEEKSSPGIRQGQLDAYRLFADLKADLSKVHENGEIVVKMETDTWIVAKVSNRREYYAILNHKNTNILDIDEEIRKLTDSHLNQIFFQD